MSAAPGRRCEVCESQLASRQRWCLECGSASLARVAPTPRWRPIALAATAITALALAGVGYAIATLLSS